MADHEPGQRDDHGDENIDLVMGKAVVKGAVIGLPLMVVFFSAVVWFITDQSLATSVTTGLLPGILFGVFGGGFIGVLGAMDH